MSKCDKLVERLANELGVERIEWTETEGCYPIYSFDGKIYTLKEDSIFVRNTKTKKTTCYACGGEIRVINRGVPEGKEGKCMVDYHMWCDNCHPEPKTGINQFVFPVESGHSILSFH